jgi:hypothetical protein
MDEPRHAYRNALVVADRDGNVIGAAMPNVGRRGNPAPRLSITPLEGQVVRSVELTPEIAASAQGAQLARSTLRQYRLQVDGDEGTLVRRSGSEEGEAVD